VSIEKKKVPYEFLVRWDTDGNVTGQHVQYREVIYDTVTSEIYSDKPGNALPVTDAGAYPLQDVLTEIQASQAINIQTLQDNLAIEVSAKDTLESEKATLMSEKSALEAERAILQSDKADLQSQLAAQGM
jgi:hypothetical protein